MNQLINSVHKNCLEHKKLLRLLKISNFQVKAHYMYLFFVSFCIIKITKNNLFVCVLTILDLKTIFCFSSAQKNILQNYNTTAISFIGRLLGEYIGLLFKKLNFNHLIIKIKGISKNRRTFLSGLLKYQFVILYIEDNSLLPHNGCRFNKKRRRHRQRRLS